MKILRIKYSFNDSIAVLFKFCNNVLVLGGVGRRTYPLNEKNYSPSLHLFEQIWKHFWTQNKKNRNYYTNLSIVFSALWSYVQNVLLFENIFVLGSNIYYLVFDNQNQKILFNTVEEKYYVIREKCLSAKNCNRSWLYLPFSEEFRCRPRGPRDRKRVFPKSAGDLFLFGTCCANHDRNTRLKS